MTERDQTGHSRTQTHRWKVVTLIVVAVLLLGGGINTAILSMTTDHGNTAKPNTAIITSCTTALQDADADADAATAAADELLAVTAKRIVLDGGVGLTRLYTGRHADQGRKSGQELVDDVKGAKEALTQISQPQACDDRASAAVIADVTSEILDATENLTAATSTLSQDVQAFIGDEIERINAEKKAAQDGAEEARKAA